MKKYGKWIGLVLVVALISGYLIQETGRQSHTSNADDDTTPVTAMLGHIEMTVEASGRVIPLTEATLAFNVPGTVAKVLVGEGEWVEAGDPLLQLESSAQERAMRLAEQSLVIQEVNLVELRKGAPAEDIAAAEAAAASAKAQLDQLLVGPREQEIAVAEANLKAAQSSLWAATQNRDQISAGPTAAEIAAVEAQVASALTQQKIAQDTYDKVTACETVTLPTGEKQKICPGLGTPEEQARYHIHAADEALESAHAQLEQVLGGATEEQLNVANANISTAAAQRDAAQAQLDLLLAGSTGAQITAARAQLAQAQANLATLRAGVSDERLAMAEAQVEQARIMLKDAQDKLADTTLLVPFDGMLTSLTVESGEWTMAGSPVATLTDLTAIEIELSVDEVDIGQISVGQSARVTLETWPKDVIPATVTRIAPMANVGTGVVTYLVYLAPDIDNNRTGFVINCATGSTDDRVIRPGMTANVEVITQQLKDVLLLPNRAIQADRFAGRYTVERVDRDRAGKRQIETIEIDIGLRNATHTQVLSELKPGDEVLIHSIEKHAAPVAPGQRLFGGG